MTNLDTNDSWTGDGATTRQFATFLLDEYYFGVEVLRVQEVIRYQDMTRVPLAPDVVQGLINLRGQIVTAIDLRRRCEAASAILGWPAPYADDLREAASASGAAGLALDTA